MKLDQNWCTGNVLRERETGAGAMQPARRSLEENVCKTTPSCTVAWGLQYHSSRGTVQMNLSIRKGEHLIPRSGGNPDGDHTCARGRSQPTPPGACFYGRGAGVSQPSPPWSGAKMLPQGRPRNTPLGPLLVDPKSQIFGPKGPERFPFSASP